MSRADRSRCTAASPFRAPRGIKKYHKQEDLGRNMDGRNIRRRNIFLSVNFSAKNSSQKSVNSPPFTAHWAHDTFRYISPTSPGRSLQTVVPQMPLAWPAEIHAGCYMTGATSQRPSAIVSIAPAHLRGRIQPPLISGAAPTKPSITRRTNPFPAYQCDVAPNLNFRRSRPAGSSLAGPRRGSVVGRPQTGASDSCGEQFTTRQKRRVWFCLDFALVPSQRSRSEGPAL